VLEDLSPVVTRAENPVSDIQIGIQLSLFKLNLITLLDKEEFKLTLGLF
jgi:hypothetical protein